jgi:osmotically-inducible protein OsmY
MAAMVLLAAGTPLFASETDNNIESSFKESYVSQNYLKGDTVKAESKDGVVTLSGTVNDASHKGLAEETAQDLPGVKSVDNRLELKAEYPAEKSNEWLAMKTRAALFFHRNVSVENTHVYVEEGIVTLRGEASSEAQKELTAEYANVEGAKEVRNEMTVAKAPKNGEQTMQEKIDDASITAQVKMALLFHRSTSALKTSVATKEGIVTVSGKAANAAEKDLVTKLVSDIHGVNSVVNNMTRE